MKLFSIPLKFLKTNKLPALIITILFFMSAFFGSLIYELSPEASEKFIIQLKEKFGPLTEKIKTSPIEAAFLIFSNNLFVSVITIFGGFILILPPFIVFSNGLLLGLIATHSLKIGKSIFLLLPHGIFELPAFFLAATLGIKISMMLFEKREKRKKQMRNFFKNIFSFLLIIIILLMIAAFIEATLGFFISR